MLYMQAICRLSHMNSLKQGEQSISVLEPRPHDQLCLNITLGCSVMKIFSSE